MSDALGALLSHMKLGVVCSSPKLKRQRQAGEGSAVKSSSSCSCKGPRLCSAPTCNCRTLFCPHRHSMETVLRRAYRPDPHTHKVKQINLSKFKITLNYTANLKLALAT